MMNMSNYSSLYSRQELLVGISGRGVVAIVGGTVVDTVCVVVVIVVVVVGGVVVEATTGACGG